MLLPLLAGAVIASSPSPDTPAAQAAPVRPPASIDSLLRSQDQSTDEDSAPGAPAQGPIPYGEVDARAYDSALKNAAAAARSASGPLDGGWVLASADGHRMYRFQFQDRGYGMSQAEGAWRDLDGGARLQGSGFINQIDFGDDGLILRFYEGGADDEVRVTIKREKTGGWSGQLLRHGSFTQVVFTRD